MKRRIYGITGLKGAGKDTAGKAILAYLNDIGVWHINFADSVKAVCAEVFGLKHEEMYGDPEIKERVLERWPFKSPRVLMQLVGTELFRDNFPGVWIHRWRRAVSDHVGNVVTTDFRFADEAEALRAEGAVLIRVVRPGLVADGHRSERYASSLAVDVELVNDSRNAAEFMVKSVKALVDGGWLPRFEQKMNERMLLALTESDPPEFKAGDRVQDLDDGTIGVVQKIEEGYGGAIGAMVTWESIGLTTWQSLSNLRQCDVGICRVEDDVERGDVRIAS
jgi:hypothetical protein